MLDPINTKTPLQSKTIITAITGVLTVLALIGVKLVVSDQDVQRISEGVAAVVVIVQFVLTGVFRKMATQQIASSSDTTPTSGNLL